MPGTSMGNMVDAPELKSMTRRSRVRPLIAAWVFVFVLLGTGVVWLSLSADTESYDSMSAPVADEDTAAPDRQHRDPSPVDMASDMASDPAPVPEETDRDETPPAPDSITLVKAPIPGLVMAGANGPLPVLGPDNMVAWKAYARPHDASGDRPRIAIIVTGMGLNKEATELAISSLPGEFDLGFSPYGRNLQQWMDQARAAGHEGFLMLPAEPLDYPDNDPGPHALLTGATERDNLRKLDWVLSQVTGYVGVINEMGSKFSASEADLVPVLADLHGRGLMLLDSRSSRYSVMAKLARRISMPRAFNNLYIDNVVSAAEIASSLEYLENTARTYGVAVGVARAYPLSIRELAKWARGLEARGFELVPVTAIANQQPLR